MATVNLKPGRFDNIDSGETYSFALPCIHC